jgi:hypothetical protein
VTPALDNYVFYRENLLTEITLCKLKVAKIEIKEAANNPNNLKCFILRWNLKI